jgi:hypothetical protein
MMSKYRFMGFLCDLRIRIPKEAIIMEEDIINYEEIMNVKFPLAYKEFLLICGKYRGSSFFTSNYYIDNYPKMWKLIKEELHLSKSPFKFSDSLYPFAEFLEYGKFWYFKLDEGDNPPVYSYIENHLFPQKEYATFTDCVKDQHWFKNNL